MQRGMDEWSRLYQQHKRHVYRRALQILGNTADAEEATQEIFLKVMRSDVDLEGRELLAWMYRITTNHCLDHLRVHKRRRELMDEHVRPNTSDRHEITPEAAMTLRTLLTRADSRQAECVTYVYIDQLSYDETAEVMGVSRRTVSNLINRFREWAQGQVEVKEAR